jgi:hypothetical protein
MAVKKAAKKPVPDLKSATSNALAHIADWAENQEWDVLFGLSPTARTTREETEVLAEAKKLAVNYIRMGVSK